MYAHVYQHILPTNQVLFNEVNGISIFLHNKKKGKNSEGSHFTLLIASSGCFGNPFTELESIDRKIFS